MPSSTLLPPTIPLAVPPEAPREPFRPRNRRRILCVFPRYADSFGTMNHSFKLMSVKAFMPPQGILVIAAYLPEEWEVRLVDENRRPATAEEFAWADAVFVSGMHIQREFIRDILRRAREHGKVSVLGGPSVSGSPDWYPEADILHVGELGDATDAILARLDRTTERPERQEVYTTAERLPLDRFPLPAYHLIRPTDYFLSSIQFSSGCPYRCEFCDIPELYGRNPRLKTPQQVTAELDLLLSYGNPGAVYFVDDNLIGNQKAALALLEELVRWQKERGYPLQFACEATLNLAQIPRAMELMREAYFVTVFCGIETPEEEALNFMQKKQNLRQPILEAVKTINSYGLEVVSGIIIGLDTDTPSTGDRIVRFIEESAIPMLTINMLHALPRTPLWRRLEAEGRLLDGEGLESNVQFLLPRETVVRMWLDTITRAYTPEAIFDRFDYHMRETFARRVTLPNSPARINGPNIRRGLTILSKVLWHAGVTSHYRRRFWKTIGPALLRGKIEDVIHIGVVAHHMIMFARECASGGTQKSFYSPTAPEAVVVEAA